MCPGGRVSGLGRTECRRVVVEIEEGKSSLWEKKKKKKKKKGSKSRLPSTRLLFFLHG
jgi:hypothetical protein